MYAARRSSVSGPSLPVPLRRRSEPKSLALLVDVVLARYGILPTQPHAERPVKHGSNSRRQEQILLFPIS